MPNIELHGYSSSEQRDLFAQTNKALEGADFYDEVVITLYNDVVANFKDKQQPFIRIFTSEHEEEVIEALEKAGINEDIEVVQIRFLPKKE